MGGKSAKRETSVSQPVLLPEQKRIWDFLTQQLIPQALGKETTATQIATQRARDEGANLLNLQQAQINQMATQGLGSGQRASLVNQAQQASLQNTLRNILAQRAAAQQQGFQLLSGLPIQPGKQTISKGAQEGKEGFGGQLLGTAGAAAGAAFGGPAGTAIGGAAGKAVGKLFKREA
jgi:hypothetical protein